MRMATQRVRITPLTRKRYRCLNMSLSAARTSGSNDDRRTRPEPATAKSAKLEETWLLLANSGLGEKVSGGETVRTDELAWSWSMGDVEGTS